MAIFFLTKEKVNGDRRDGSGHKRTCYSSRGPKFGIQTYTVLTVTHPREPNTFSCMHKHVDKPLRQR